MTKSLWLSRLFGARVRSRVSPFRLMPITAQQTNLPRIDEAVRWLGAVTIGGRTCHSLFCHPASEVSYTLTAPPRSRVVTRCALLPDAWAHNTGGVDFTVAATVEGSPRPAVRTVHVAARDRAWRTITVDLANTEARSVRVQLSTSVPAGRSDAHAWAVFGEPVLESRRPIKEMIQLVRPVVKAASRADVAALKQAVRAVVADSSGYAEWARRAAPSPADLEAMSARSRTFALQPLISVITPVYNTDPRWLRAAIESVRRQAYGNWQLCLCDDGSTRADTQEVLRQYASDPRIVVTRLQANSGISAASNAALESASGEFVALLDHDDEMTPDALFHVAAYLNEHPDAQFMHSDEDKLDPDGSRCDPFFKPDWSPEHFLSAMYTCHLMVARRALVQEVGGFRLGYEGAQDYDLALRLIDRTQPHHIARVLYHWRKIAESTASAGGAKPWAHDAGRKALEDYARRNALDADVQPGGVPGLYRMRFAVKNEPLVSVVLNEPGDATGFERSVKTLAEHTGYRRFEVILITPDGRLPRDVAAWLDGTPSRAIAAADAGNVSRQLNAAAMAAQGDHLLFLGGSLEAHDDSWLSALLEYSQQLEVGAVGGKLVYPDRRLKHIGLIVGVGGAAAPAFHRHSAASYGHFSSAIGVRNYSAVARACLMTRRRVFEEAGGFNEALPRHFNDVDYCLRLLSRGYRAVFTPYASFTDEASPVAAEGEAEERARLQALWGDRLARDPYYNPHLSRASADYEVNL